jgi:hypothetical protein
MSAGSYQTVHLAPETVVGTTPNPFNRQLMRFTSVSVDGQMNETESEEIVDTPLSSGSFKTGVTYGGELAGELSYGTYDDLFASIFRNEWAAVSGGADNEMVLSLAAIKKTFSLLRGYTDAGGYHLFKGLFVTSLSLEIPEEGIATVTFGLTGQGREPVTFTVPLGTVTPATDTDQMTNAGTDEFILDGQAMTDLACVSAFTLSMEWTTASQQCFGKGLSAGKILATSLAVTGTFTAAWGDEAASLNELKYTNTAVSIAQGIKDEAGNKYIIRIPEATITGELPSGARGDLLQYQFTYTLRKQSPTLTRIPA